MYFPNNYEFFCPVKICSGNKALDHLPFELELLDAKKPLVVTNKEVSGNRQTKRVIQAFKDSHITIGISDEVPCQADLKVVYYLAELYRENGCDSIITVGGGSIFDAAKVANLAVSEDTDDLKQFTEEGAIKKPLKPFAAVLTSLGTGFETTKLAAIEGMNFSSQFLMPNLVVIDPRMIIVENAQATVAAAMTALAHAVEAYTCPAKNPLTDMYAYPAIQLISENLINMMKHPGDKNGRVALVNAAFMAGCAFSTSTVGLIHKLGQAVSNSCHLSLGICMGFLLPYVLEYSTSKNAYNTSDLLLPLTNPDVYTSTSEDQRALYAIDVIRKLLKDIYAAAEGEIPSTLQAAKVSKEKLKDVAQAVSFDGSKEFDADACLMVLEHAWEGKPIKSPKSKVQS